MTRSTPIIEEMSVDDTTLDFQFMLDTNGMTELRRNIEKKAAITKNRVIYSKEYTDNLSVKTRDLDAKNGDMYRMRAQMLTRGVPRFVDQKVAALLASDGAAFTEASFDGVPYFSAAHPMNLAGEDLAPYSNLDSGGAGEYWYLFDTSLLKPVLWNWKTRPKTNDLGPDSEHAKKFFEVMWNLYADAGLGMGLWHFGAASNQALDETHFDELSTVMSQVPTYAKGTGKQLMGVMPNLLVVGASNKLKAQKLIGSATINGGDPNPLYNIVQVLPLPYLP
jgi:phage major head subunit gpT-like protein